ncbi:MAG: hypothetical protein KF718_33440 [Polyangiaceae bacterium]|nr:hypothetical protein [Polyangiaceae bacterium]
MSSVRYGLALAAAVLLLAFGCGDRRGGDPAPQPDAQAGTGGEAGSDAASGGAAGDGGPLVCQPLGGPCAFAAECCPELECPSGSCALPSTTNSCAGKCGGFADSCACDAACEDEGDCCPDRAQHCG